MSVTRTCQSEDDHVCIGDLILPAEDLRLCGPEFADDRYFLSSAKAEADRLIRHCGLDSNSSVLDVGCGMGRLPIGILSAMSSVRSYCGIDVSQRSIDWCIRHIHLNHPAFTFVHLDIKHDRYNPSGREVDRELRLPFAANSFNIIYLYSVFSHMLPADMRIYLSEFQRLLRNTGRVFLTAFVEERVPDVSVNPEGYRMNWSGPLHCVRYSRDFIVSSFAGAGFALQQFDYGTETDGQSGMYLRKAYGGDRLP